MIWALIIVMSLTSGGQSTVVLTYKTNQECAEQSKWINKFMTDNKITSATFCMMEEQ